MARAAVKAKQAQRAQAQAAVKPSRKRGHASGGNPNQDLFFSRLRRRQKWVFLALALVFAISFVFIGVGSGNGGGLSQLYSGIFGGSGDAVGKAESEIKTDAPKGYLDLANAYVAKGDLTDAISAMQTHLNMKKTDSASWAQLARWENEQGQNDATQYSQALQTSQLQSPGTIFQPGGSLAGQLGSNPIDEYYSQQNQTVIQPLLQDVETAYNASTTDYQQAAKYAKPSDRATAELLVAGAAQVANDTKTELKALQIYVQLAPHASTLKQIEKQCKSLGGSCVPKSKHK